METGALPPGDPDDAELNVRQFGAGGNEVADDTDAIQRAIDALPSSRGGTVVFPPGTYRITRPLRPISNCRLVGGGFTDRAVNPVPTSQITGPALTQPLIECGSGLTSVQLLGLGSSGESRSGSKGLRVSGREGPLEVMADPGFHHVTNDQNRPGVTANRFVARIKATLAWRRRGFCARH